MIRVVPDGTLLPPATWATGRLAVRPPARADAQRMFAEYASDPEVSKYMIWRPHRGIDETKEFIRRCERDWAQGTAFPWCLTAKSDGAFLGLLAARVRPPAMDIGYAVVRKWWRRGFMSEAVTALIRWAFEQPRLERVWATCDCENVASAGLLEHVGMQREGILRRWILHPNVSDAARDCFCYSIVKPAG